MKAVSMQRRRARTGRRFAAAAAMATVFLMGGCGTFSRAADLPAAPDTAPAASPAGQDSPDPSDATAADPTGDASCPADIVARICAEVNLTGATPVSGRGIVTAPEPPGSDPSTTSVLAAMAAQ